MEQRDEGGLGVSADDGGAGVPVVISGCFQDGELDAFDAAKVADDGQQGEGLVAGAGNEERQGIGKRFGACPCVEAGEEGFEIVGGMLQGQVLPELRGGCQAGALAYHWMRG